MRNFLLSMLLGTAAMAALTQPARAIVAVTDSEFQFTGVCNDCTGVGTGTLTVQNYTPGTPFTRSEFVDFTYTSNLFPPSSPFEITSADVANFSGSINTTPGPYNVEFNASGSGALFFSFVGTDSSPWCLGQSSACAADQGPTHLWTPVTTNATVPEPVSLALLGTGLLGFAATRVRRSPSNGAE